MAKKTPIVKQKLELLADYVDELFRDEASRYCCPDCTTSFCPDCAEQAFNNDYLRNLANLRVELRKRLATLK